MHHDSKNVVDGTTWEFARTGWWALHVGSIALTFWLGHRLTHR